MLRFGDCDPAYYCLGRDAMYFGRWNLLHSFGAGSLVTFGVSVSHGVKRPGFSTVCVVPHALFVFDLQPFCFRTVPALAPHCEANRMLSLLTVRDLIVGYFQVPGVFLMSYISFEVLSWVFWMLLLWRLSFGH